MIGIERRRCHGIKRSMAFSVGPCGGPPVIAVLGVGETPLDNLVEGASGTDNLGDVDEAVR